MGIKKKVIAQTLGQISTFYSERKHAIVRALDCQYYFTHPYRFLGTGSNQNLSRLIRQYFPEKMILDNISNEEIKTVEIGLSIKHSMTPFTDRIRT